ncbi:unnamed protein product [Urochloa decumbens]|uniref:Uncharacterized protein n=1 Tax=Urochloa decumbens TaxID=240449 RepID=A0ABC8YC10_9POAL
MARTDRSLFTEARLVSKKRRKRTCVRSDAIFGKSWFCRETIRAQASAEVACLRLRSSSISSSDMGSTRSWSSRLLAVSALVCLLATLGPAAMVNGLRREELVLGRDPAPVPAEAPMAGAGAGANAVGVDAAGRQFVAPAATTVGAVQMSKWRVRRGSDPIHNRS